MVQGELPSARRIVVDANEPDAASIEAAASTLRNGGLVAFPTETVYGLGANALDAAAVGGIFKAKGRPADNPLIVHIHDLSLMEIYIDNIPSEARLLARRFWPGPLTMVLRGGDVFPRAVTGGLSTVGMRVPAHPVALALIKAAGVPVAAPSANASGRPSPTTADHVLDDLANRIDLVLDGGRAGLGLESTVLDLTGEFPVILRPGGVTRPQLEELLGPVKLDPSLKGEPVLRPSSPGMKYTHYAPRAPLTLFEGAHGEQLAGHILAVAGQQSALGRKVGVLTCEENAHFYHDVADAVVVVGRSVDPSSIAANLYESLRRFDQLGVDIILAEGVSEDGFGLAIMNRLRRAAGGKVVLVGK